jgi:putative flippase GtrA
VIAVVALAFLLISWINYYAGTNWFLGFDNAVAASSILVVILAAGYIRSSRLIEIDERGNQAKKERSNPAPEWVLSNTKRRMVLSVAILPVLVIAVNYFFGSNWFGRYGAAATAASMFVFVFLTNYLGRINREAKQRSAANDKKQIR